jgi:exodeoxyribonuclease VII small subunit
MTAKAAPKKDKSADFETSLKRLETIVSEMESGKLSLEDMLTRFEEGQGLLKFCTTKLDEVERRIEVLVKKGDKTTTEPFEPETDVPGDAPTAGDELF